jgi:prepilin-type N-terminal cleavage/methylation domain-containing protein
VSVLVRRRAFSLLELVVVLVVLAVLASLAIPTSSRVTSRARVGRASTEVRAALRSALALAALGPRAVTASDLEDTAADLGLVLVGPEEVLTAPDQLGAAVLGADLGAARLVDGSCVLARTRGTSTEALTLPAGRTCSASQALGGAAPGSVSAPDAGVELTAPTGLSAAALGGALDVSWEPVDGADSYSLSWDSASGVSGSSSTVSTSALVTGLGPEDLTEVRVSAMSGARAGATASTSATTRKAGLHDVEVLWNITSDGACFGGASSWSWRAWASGSERDSGAYRVGVRTTNDAAPGVDPWVSAALLRDDALTLSSATVRVCAPPGASTASPPFDSVRVQDVSTLAPAPLGRTSSAFLSPERVTHVADADFSTPRALSR